MIDSCSYTPIKSHACIHSNNLNDIGNSCMLHPAMCIVTEADLRGIKRLEGSLENGIYMHACTRLAKSGLLSRAIRDKELIINIYKYYKYLRVIVSMRPKGNFCSVVNMIKSPESYTRRQSLSNLELRTKGTCQSSNTQFPL